MAAKKGMYEMIYDIVSLWDQSKRRRTSVDFHLDLNYKNILMQNTKKYNICYLLSMQVHTEN